MGVQAKDGSTHHSAGRASLHDSMSAGAAKASHQKVAPMTKPGGKTPQNEGSGKTPAQIPHDHPHMAGPHQTPTETPISEHVGQHGPATSIMHTESEGKHHVTSHHGGMGQNMHHSSHDSHESAHEHMGAAMGGEAKSDESPDEVNENPAETASTAGAKIPGLV